MDFIERGLSRSTGIRIFYCEVTESAATLERRHLSGPTAGRVLGEAIAAVALLSANLKKDDESVSLQLKTDGPIGGVMADASGVGGLRGYTHKKILNDFDGEENGALDAVMGSAGNMAVIRSNSARVLGVGQVQATPPSVRTGLARYYNDSLQTPTAVELYSVDREGFLRRVAGIVADRMPDGSHDAFCTVIERFNSGAVRRFLDSSTRILDFKELFELDDIETLERRDLRFCCNCNYEKITEAVSTLPDQEIREILDSSHSQRVTCHFCGEIYTIRKETLREILEWSARTGRESGGEASDASDAESPPAPEGDTPPASGTDS